MIAYYFERSMFEDLCDGCGDWAFLVAVCDFNTGRRVKEICETCFEKWQLEEGVTV